VELALLTTAINQFLVSKSINITASKIISLLNDNNDISEPLKNIEAGIIDIQNDLSILISAPYKNALDYLKLGNKTKASEELINAINYDDLNLPARLLYIKLLLDENRVDLAIEKYWDILDMFGIRDDVVPKCLVDLFVEDLRKNTVITNTIKIYGFGSNGDFSKHGKFTFSKHTCVIQEKNIIKAYNLDNGDCILFEFGETLNLTNRYLIIKKTDTKKRFLKKAIVTVTINIYDSKTGKYIRSISQDQYDALFSYSAKKLNWISKIIKENIAIDITEDRYTKTEYVHTSDYTYSNDVTEYSATITLSPSEKSLTA